MRSMAALLDTFVVSNPHCAGSVVGRFFHIAPHSLPSHLCVVEHLRTRRRRLRSLSCNAKRRSDSGLSPKRVFSPPPLTPPFSATAVASHQATQRRRLSGARLCHNDAHIVARWIIHSQVKKKNRMLCSSCLSNTLSVENNKVILVSANVTALPVSLPTASHNKR